MLVYKIFLTDDCWHHNPHLDENYLLESNIVTNVVELIQVGFSFGMPNCKDISNCSFANVYGNVVSVRVLNRNC